MDDDEAARGAAANERALAGARAHLRDVAGRVALERASTPEGRAAGASVDVWPTRGVWLRVSSGHELRLGVELRDGVPHVTWERHDPRPGGAAPRVSRSSLGPATAVGELEVRVLLSRWLAWRLRG